MAVHSFQTFWFAIGWRGFDESRDRQGGRRFAPEAKIIHIDIDPGRQISKNVVPWDLPIVGECQNSVGRR